MLFGISRSCGYIFCFCQENEIFQSYKLFLKPENSNFFKFCPIFQVHSGGLERLARRVPCRCRACQGASTSKTTKVLHVCRKNHQKISFFDSSVPDRQHGSIKLATPYAPELFVCFGVPFEPRRPPCPRYVGEEGIPKKLGFEPIWDGSGILGPPTPIKSLWWKVYLEYSELTVMLPSQRKT